MFVAIILYQLVCFKVCIDRLAFKLSNVMSFILQRKEASDSYDLEMT